MKLSLDLTPWVRGPHTGVGLAAWRSFQALREAGGDVRALHRTRTRVDGLASMKAWDRLAGDPGEIFHSFELKLPPRIRSRRVLSVHDCWTLFPNEFQSPEFQRRQRHKLVKALRRAHRILTPTEVVRQQLIRWDANLESRVGVVGWGPLVAEKARANSMAIRPYILVVATIEKRKNHALLCRALERVAGVELVLVGREGFGGEEGREAIKRLSRSVVVHRFEEIDEERLAGLYQGALAVALTSWDEGFGMPVVEGQALGKPLLLSDIPPLREVGGRGALYFDPAEGHLELAEAIRRLRDDAAFRDEQSLLAREAAKAHSWETTAGRLRSEYSLA